MPVFARDASPGYPLFIFSLAFSTMDIARRLTALNFPEGTAVMAEEQIAGRGTKGRTWHSARGKGLYVSFILRPSASSFNLLPAACGLAAAEAIEELSGVRIQLKWPNDLVYQEKKLGGILCEGWSAGGRQTRAVAGIGINLNHRLSDFPPEIKNLATSLFLLTEKTWKPLDLLRHLGLRLKVWYNNLEKGHFDLVLASYRKRLSFKAGQKLLLQTVEGQLTVEFQDLEERGGLKVRVDGETRIFHASEIIKVF